LRRWREGTVTPRTCLRVRVHGPKIHKRTRVRLDHPIDRVAAAAADAHDLDAAGRRHERRAVGREELRVARRRGAFVSAELVERGRLERLRAELRPIEAAAEELRGLDRCPARRQRRRARGEDDKPRHGNGT